MIITQFNLFVDHVLASKHGTGMNACKCCSHNVDTSRKPLIFIWVSTRMLNFSLHCTIVIFIVTCMLFLSNCAFLTVSKTVLMFFDNLP